MTTPRYSTPAEYRCEACSRDLLDLESAARHIAREHRARAPQAKLPRLDPLARTTRRAVTNRPHHERKS